MSTRCVRGESGAIFEVDASMLAQGTRPEHGYRESSAPPHVRTIVAARPRSSGTGTWALAVCLGAMSATLLAVVHGALR